MSIEIAERERPKVLVLMAVRNGLPWIFEQIDSILGQTRVDVTLVCRDDCSTDRSVEEIKAKYFADGRLSVLTGTSPSGSAGANFRQLFIDAELSAFDYVALADQDDVWNQDKLSDAIAAMKESRSSGYSSAVRAAWPDGRTAVIRQDARIRRADFLFEGAGQGCTFVLAAQFFARVQQFLRLHWANASRLHYHDWLLYLLTRAWNLQWHFDGTPSMTYRQHEGNELGARGSLGSVVRRLALIRNGWYLQQLHASCEIYLLAGGKDAAALSLTRRLLSVSRTGISNWILAWLIMRHGRRKIADRMALTSMFLFCLI